jgi:N-acetylglucosaminyl-diphospho-decaprenol L-rhamnosyltransferase
MPQVCEESAGLSPMRASVIAAVLVHYGDIGRSVRAVRVHAGLGVFSKIVVVANDMSPRPAELSDDTCIWVIPAKNLGFGGGCQLGATACAADVYAFFNAHVSIDKDSVAACVSAFEYEDVGIAAPYVYYPGQKDPDSNWKYTYCRRTYSRFVRIPIHLPLECASSGKSTISQELADNDWLGGAAIFCRAEVIQEVGWDGSFFLTFEDVDISLRAKRSGWRVVAVPSAIAYHSGESTRELGASSYYGTRNAIWFARRHHGKLIQAMLTICLSARLFRVAVADVLKRRRPAHAKPAVRGIWHGWLMLPAGPEPLDGEPLAFARKGAA